MKPKSWIISALLVLSMLVIITACGTNTTGGTNANGKIKVIATLFPQYDFVKEIAKDKADVTLLLPPGIESHSYEPSPKEIADIMNAGIFIYTGEYMEPWAHRIIESSQGKSIIIVDTSKGIEMMDEEDDHHEHDDEPSGHEPEEANHHHGGKDPHIWLDPVLAQKMVDNIVEGLIKADRNNESFYKANGESYKKKLQELDKKFSEAFKKTNYNKIMYGGHFAFGYFAKRYALEHVSPYRGFAPDAEPTPQRIAELIKTINETGLKTIYYEELVDPKVAKVIADQTGTQIVLLHGAHNVSKEELSAGVSYIKIMEDNLEKLKQGLGYNE